MTIELADRPLVPTPDEARSQLRRELLRPEYQDKNPVRRLLDWLGRQLDHGVSSSRDTSPLTWLAITVIVVALVGAVVVLAARARRTARDRADRAAVLTDAQVTAAELRARAEQALAEERFGDAIVDGFRAVAVRQVERGRLDDRPGATAHEVARDLGAALPDRADLVEASALLFDAVMYGEREGTREQALEVLALESELLAAR